MEHVTTIERFKEVFEGKTPVDFTDITRDIDLVTYQPMLIMTEISTGNKYKFCLELAQDFKKAYPELAEVM